MTWILFSKLCACGLVGFFSVAMGYMISLVMRDEDVPAWVYLSVATVFVALACGGSFPLIILAEVK